MKKNDTKSVRSNIFKSCFSVIVASTIMAFSTQVSAAPSLKIAYFGDSTAAGTRTRPPGYPLQNLSQQPCVYTPYDPNPPEVPIDNTDVHEYIKAGVPVASVVVKYGVNGRSAEEQATQYLIEFEERLISNNYGMVILNYGINDARYQRSKEDYVKDMKALVAAAHRHGAFVVIEKPNPIKECTPWKALPVANPIAPAVLLESYRNELNTLAGPNVAFVDHGVWSADPNWHLKLADPLHPNHNAYIEKAALVANKINSLQWCGLSVNRTFVDPNDSFSYAVSHSHQTGFKAYWFGTKNGVMDMSGVEAATLTEPGQLDLGTYTNQQGYVGTYTRWMTIKNNANAIICITPVITIQIAAQSACPLTVMPEVVPSGGTYKFTFQGPAGTYGWYGTGANGGMKETVPNTSVQTYTYTNQPGWTGVYDRQLKDDNLQGCSSNNVSVELK